MSRINAGIPVIYLTDEHLRAEHREIKRICALYKQRGGKLDKACGESFTLGEGHLLFFLNKGLYTYTRYKLIHEECLKRGFEVTDFSANWKIFDKSHRQNWEPEKIDKIRLVNRITERLRDSNQIPHYYSKQISVQDAVNLIRKSL